MKINYYTYIRSQEWFEKHKWFLLESGYRCAMFSFIICGKGHPYRIHHKTYKNLGKETLWQDVIVLCPFAHDFIIHGILSGFKSAGKQKGKYPNKAQRIAHTWCCFPLVGKLSAIGCFVFTLSLLATAL